MEVTEKKQEWRDEMGQKWSEIDSSIKVVANDSKCKYDHSNS
jgi:hypothetical protein